MIDNIFTALVRKKTAGTILEFVLWCGICFAVLVEMAAFALGKGNVTWMLLMLFSIGFGVLMAFCLRGIAIIYSICTFGVINLLMHFFVFVNGFYGGESSSPLNILLLIFALLLGIGAAACAFVQFFSKFRLGKITAVMVLCESVLIMLLQVSIYAVGFLGNYFQENKLHRSWMNARGYWLGTLGYWMILAVVCVYLCSLFWGPIEKAKSKLSGQAVPEQAGGYAGGQAMFQAGGGAPDRQAMPWTGGYVQEAKTEFHPGMQGLRGIYAGRVFYFQGREFTIGSGEEADIPIVDVYVSRMHCAVHYQASREYYEILDQSRNGVFLADGTMMQKGVYCPLPSGSVICIGSAGQQFKLL